jgi:hypothetical protein
MLQHTMGKSALCSGEVSKRKMENVLMFLWVQLASKWRAVWDFVPN